MRRFRKATIRDVAEKAGVSITTVSRFVSGSENVCSAETAERIRSVIADLQYTPSQLVGSVQRRATKTLGVCIYSPLDPEIAYGSAFFERLWRGVIAQSDAEGYSLLHYPSDVRNSVSTDPFLDGRIDGLLYHSSGLLTQFRGSADTRPARLAAAGMPTVVLTRSQGLPDSLGAAYADEVGTVDLTLSHLWEQGHRRIAHLAGPTNFGVDIALSRLEAYRNWMQAHGAYDPELEGQANEWRADETRIGSIVSQWRALKAPPTAIFAANDSLALVAIAAARARGWDVPGELSVVGVDNSREAVEAGLTSVDPPIEEIGRASVRALLSLLQEAPIASCRIAVPVTNIVLRESTASRRSKER